MRPTHGQEFGSWLIRLVIIDDETDLLDLLKLILTEKTDYNILTTTDPKQALDWCREYHADVLISDLRMPQLEGIELLKLLKLQDKTIPFHYYDRLRHH